MLLNCLETRQSLLCKFSVSKLPLPIPRLSKAGMPSRSEGWGGLFKDEQYRLIRSASRASIRWLRIFEQTTRRFAPPLLTKEGIGAKPRLLP